MSREQPKTAIDPKPLVGGEINLRLALSPSTIILLAAPATVLLTMLLAWLTLKTAGIPVHPGEMLAGAIANILGGIAGSLPLFILMRKGAAAIAQAGLLGIALRLGTVLCATLIATAAAWGLQPFPLILWVMAFYFPLLIVETSLVAWLCHKAKH